jgi:rubredoxin
MQQAMAILERDYLESTGLAEHELRSGGVVFDESAGATVCPACGCTFVPTTTTCPECGLSFG